MGYLLDTGMLSAIEDGCRGLPDSVRRAPARWRGVLSVSGVVWGEFERERSGSAFKTALKADARFEGLAVLSLPLTDASLVESIRGEYPAGKATKNLGEVESLELLESLCPELTWASLDNGAVARALTRLGQHRLISPYRTPRSS